ncbi:MAG: hypothetical protein JO187_08765 [Acidobacteria bacterium]|nr:hypothetical protein [Acidobacteriota bacterium]
MRFSATRVLFCCLLIGALVTLAGAQAVRPDSRENGKSELRPTGKGWGQVDHSAWRTSRTGNGISYHGGPVMTGGPTIHYIWYGNWSSGDASAVPILDTLRDNIGGSSYFNINTTYTNSAGTHVSNHVGHSSDDHSNDATTGYSKSLSDADILSIVQNVAGSSPDPNGVYFVLTTADVNETSGFCTQYCGWHDHATISGVDTKYAFVGNPDRCPSACEWQTTSPNGNAGADGMASIIAHELEEATSDPDLNAWYDSRGYENADKCAWTFSPVSSSNGYQYNISLGGRQYLIQRNWVNASGGYCSMSY